MALMWSTTVCCVLKYLPCDWKLSHYEAPKLGGLWSDPRSPVVSSSVASEWIWLTQMSYRVESVQEETQSNRCFVARYQWDRFLPVSLPPWCYQGDGKNSGGDFLCTMMYECPTFRIFFVLQIFSYLPRFTIYPVISRPMSLFLPPTILYFPPL